MSSASNKIPAKLKRILRNSPPPNGGRQIAQDDRKNRIIVILGPTASGKTGWAFRLCEEFGGEIVSADSRQIYREMNIGTAKKIQETLPNGGQARYKMQKNPNSKSQIPNNSQYLIFNIQYPAQYLIDIVDPDEILTLSQYKKLAVEKINDIISRGKVPFLVGGTGLYISAIVDNLEIPEIEPDWELREKLEAKNISDLQNELKKLDPEIYKKIDLQNKRRIIRAIEVSKNSEKPFSSLQKKGKPLFDCLQIGIDISKEELHKKIDKRVDEMRKAGLEQEVRELAKKYSWNLPSMSGIGYREFRPPLLSEEAPPLEGGDKEGVLQGKCACPETLFSMKNRPYLEDVFNEIKKHTRQYAKRQMTWFRRNSEIRWTSDYKIAKNKIKDFLKV